MQRTKRSVRNVAVAMITNTVIMITAFIVQHVFVQQMGSDYNGINGLFTNILSMLSLADLGIGSAIVFHLYRPAAENDYDMISSLLEFYKNSYKIISIAVAIISGVIMYFLPYIVKDTYIPESLYYIFLLFVIDCLSSYFLAYKKSLLYAYEMNYILDGTHFFIYLLQNGVQIFILLYFQNYTAFLLVKTASKLLENMGISIYIKRKYAMILKIKAVSLKRSIRDDILKKVKALFFHKTGQFAIKGSDSIIITALLGIEQMSKSTNYEMIMGGAMSLVKMIFTTLTSSVGNFLVSGGRKECYLVYRKIDFVNYWIYSFGAVMFFCNIRPVIQLWVGKEYLFDRGIELLLMMRFFLQGIQASVDTFKNAAGIYYEDRRVPWIAAAINIVCSVLWASRWGMAGVIMGTIASYLLILFYSFPRYVCGPLFGMPWMEYICSTLRHFAFTIVMALLAERLLKFIRLDNLWLELLAGCVVVTVLYNVIFVLMNRSRPELKYFICLVHNMIGRSRTDTEQRK